MEKDWNKFFFDLHERYYRFLLYPIAGIQKVAGNPEYAEAMHFLAVMFTGEMVVGDAPLTKKMREAFLHLYGLEWRSAPRNFISVLPELQEDFQKEQFKKSEKQKTRNTTPAWVYKLAFGYLAFRHKIGFPVKLKPININVEYSEPLSEETDPRIILKEMVRWFTRKRLKRLMQERLNTKNEDEADVFDKSLVFPPISFNEAEFFQKLSNSISDESVRIQMKEIKRAMEQTSNSKIHPVFLSYSSLDKQFARKLSKALMKKNVKVWYDEDKLLPGDDIREGISKGIDLYDKFILVCSKQSLQDSWWVDKELNRVLQKEERLFKEKGRQINTIIPITIDDYVFKEWDGAKRSDIHRYNIGDFTGWQDEAKFELALDRLVAALNTDRGEEDILPSYY